MNYAPKVLEFWKVDRIPTCGLDENDGVLGFDIDNLCGDVTGSSTCDTQDFSIMARKSKGIIKNMQKPSFLKVDKVDPVKAGFIVPPHKRGRVCSLSRAVSRLEKLEKQKPPHSSAEQNTKQSKNKNTRERVMERVQSLHLEVSPVGKNKVGSCNVIAEQEELTACTEKKVEVPKPRFVHDRIRLPIRAGRNKGRGGNRAKTSDGNDVSQEKSFASQNCSRADGNRFGSSRSNNPSSPTKAIISRLPLRAGRVVKSRQDTNSTAPVAKDDQDIHPLDSQHLRKGFIERRRCLIAATKTHNEPDSHHCEIDWINTGRVDILQETSFENCSDNETMIWDNKDNNARPDKNNSKLFCTESKITRSNTSSSNATCEETLEAESNESSLVIDEKEKGRNKITKAGWITRQLGREGVLDSIEGVQNIELVYTPFV
ncbi:hypothetical protein HJC23_006953 [Cyclotella cryptica]|uniref:Uncharacterized protein n=1 Tax=Cyclotella cryptica TaxID=29204 RepID=A0ABD3QML9_9STRA|eukprot:CCRYP_004263-RA/>CCRYP_004263-RA protein AED:0.17 eAED:0.17 QI:0/-1/0/1/-1/1/1/0/428